jgi:class 3 adenylate cyclase
MIKKARSRQRTKSRGKFWQLQTIAFMAVGMVLTVVVGLMVIASVKDLVREQISRRLEGAVGLLADQIDANNHRMIRTRNDERTETYRAVVAQLRRARLRMQDIKYVYTYRVDQSGRVIFVVDAEPDPDKKSHVGDVYDDPSAAMLAAARPPYRPVIEAEITEDEWGSWLSGFAPILDANGRLEAVVGIDLSATRVSEIELQYWLRIALGGSLLAVVMAVLGGYLATRVSRPLRAVSADLGRVGKLKFDQSEQPTSSVAEVAELQQALERMKRGLQSFRRYVPGSLVTELMALNKEAVPGGEKKVLTVFFADIADFTAMAESMDPERLSRFLAVYFEVITTTISKHGGTVDKYMGDAVMAFWNAPRPIEDHAYRAVKASLEIQQKFLTMQREFEKRGWKDFRARIGLATGEALVGNIGYSERLSYTALGDPVNLASRLEGLNKHFGTGILLSEDTAKGISERILCREVDLVYVQGRNKPVSVYVPHGPIDQIMPRQREALQVYAEGLQLYRHRQWQKASEAFREFLYAWPEDGPATKLYSRCSDFLKFPPDNQWDGAFRLTVK